MVKMVCKSKMLRMKMMREEKLKEDAAGTDINIAGSVKESVFLDLRTP